MREDTGLTSLATLCLRRSRRIFDPAVAGGPSITTAAAILREDLAVVLLGPRTIAHTLVRRIRDPIFVLIVGITGIVPHG